MADKCCWVLNGNRYITIDIGCMRIDESQPMARIARDHPSHQPFSDKADADPSPRFDSWRLLNSQSGSKFDGPLYEKMCRDGRRTWRIWGSVRRSTSRLEYLYICIGARGGIYP